MTTSVRPGSQMERLLFEIKKVIVGQDHLLERMIVALLARGHLLVEGVPGLAKTLAVKTVAEAISGEFKRIKLWLHTMSFMGYARRGNPILGKVVGSSSEDASGEFAKDSLGLPYTTLSYASGPGYAGASDSQTEGPKRFPHILKKSQPTSGRPDLSQVDTEDPDYLQQAPMPLRSETHGGDDVGVWARGPGSAAVRGSIEQNVIFHLMAQAQPDIAKLLCKAGGCERGVPLALPTEASLRAEKPAQAR